MCLTFLRVKGTWDPIFASYVYVYHFSSTQNMVYYPLDHKFELILVSIELKLLDRKNGEF